MPSLVAVPIPGETTLRRENNCSPSIVANWPQIHIPTAHELLT